MDAYGEAEQVVGFHAMLEEHLAVPFRAEVLGTEIRVERIDVADDDQIVAVCARG